MHDDDDFAAEDSSERRARHLLEGATGFATVQALADVRSEMRGVSRKVTKVVRWLEGSVNDEGEPTAGLLSLVKDLREARDQTHAMVRNLGVAVITALLISAIPQIFTAYVNYQVHVAPVSAIH